MCRRNQILSAALVSFGIGVLVGGWIEWQFIGTLVALTAIGFGFLVSGRNRWHK